MGLLDEIMADDARYMHDADVFGENVTYRGSLGAGDAATYTAVIDRAPPDIVEEVTEGIAPTARVSLPYDATGTIGPASVQAGDTIAFPERKGEVAKTFRVWQVSESDSGAWVLLCR